MAWQDVRKAKRVTFWISACWSGAMQLIAAPTAPFTDRLLFGLLLAGPAIWVLVSERTKLGWPPDELQTTRRDLAQASAANQQLLAQVQALQVADFSKSDALAEHQRLQAQVGSLRQQVGVAERRASEAEARLEVEVRRARKSSDGWSQLGLPPGAALADVRAVHRWLMVRIHPDRLDADVPAAVRRASQELTRRLNDAWATIQGSPK